MKAINDYFEDWEHSQLRQKKEEMRQQLGMKTLSWREFILRAAGIK